MKPTIVKRSLICELTHEEIKNYGVELATTLNDKENVEAEKKRHADHYKDRISGLQAKADELTRKVSSGQEWRTVECLVKYGMPDKAHKLIQRMDTGEVLATEVMTDEDRQLHLGLAGHELEAEPYDGDANEHGALDLREDLSDSEGGEEE